ncbi:putative membrane protein [Streptacidiphilus sp. MAP12-16]
MVCWSVARRCERGGGGTVSGAASAPLGGGDGFDPHAPATDSTAAGDLVTLATGRVEAFSDGVIAVAATLLVLDIKEPAPGVDIWAFLGQQGPSLIAYAISFLTILIFWVNHHALFHSVERVDRPMLFINGLLLLAISFISYSTAVLGHALQRAGHYDRSAAVLYALTMTAASSCFCGLWLHLSRRGHLMVPVARLRTTAALRRSLIGPALYAAATVVALVNAPASLAVDAVVAAYFALLPRHLRRARPGR